MFHTNKISKLNQYAYWYIDNTILSCVTIIKRTSELDYMQFVLTVIEYKKVQVGKDQEKAQSEKDSHSKNRGDQFVKCQFNR